jgi:hypothetical protein
MNVAKFAVRAIKEWNPLGPEAIVRRDTNKKFRKAWRKKRRGKPLTPEEESILAGETVKMILPDGTEATRTEPLWKKRTSTKVALTSALVPLLSVIPFWDQINTLLIAACQSEQGPAVFLGGAALAWATATVTARLTKSPAKPGPL